VRAPMQAAPIPSRTMLFAMHGHPFDYSGSSPFFSNDQRGTPWKFEIEERFLLLAPCLLGVSGSLSWLVISHLLRQLIVSSTL
jgi:hypothetical protein